MSNEQLKISIDRKTIIEVLRHLNIILISLDRIGSCAGEHTLSEINEMTVQFLDEWKVTGRLAKARSLLSTYFSQDLGPDDMDELEREFADLNLWKYSDRQPKEDLSDLP